MQINTNNDRVDIFTEINAERDRQDRKWGGASHDDTHTNYDWNNYILKQLGETVIYEPSVRDIKEIIRRAYIKIAALCVAAVESIDRQMGK